MKTFIGFCALLLMTVPGTIGGELEPATDPAPTMKTLQEVYDRVSVLAGEIVHVPATGQTQCWTAGGTMTPSLCIIERFRREVRRAVRRR